MQNYVGMIQAENKRSGDRSHYQQQLLIHSVSSCCISNYY